MTAEGLLHRYIEQQELLLNVTRQIAGSMGLNETIPHILDGIDRVIRADGMRLLLTGPEGRAAVYARGPLADVMAPADAQITDLVEIQGEIEISRGQDGLHPNVLSFLPDELATVIAVPLIAHTAQHGVLWLGFHLKHALDDAERTFLYILAGQAATAIANARSYTAARKRREWLAGVLASTPDPVLVVDRDLCLQIVNPAAQEMFPTLTPDMIGQPLDQVAEVPELAAMFHAEEGSEALAEYTAPSGRSYAPKISDVRTENGEMTGWVLILRDITQFTRLNANMSKFLSTVSHDMRSPLTYMKGYLDMMGMVGELNEKQREFLDKVAGGVSQMSDLVEKVLDAGKLDPVTGDYELMREPCDLVEVFRKVVTNLSEPAAKKKLEFTSSVADGIPVLNVDRTMLSSAFTNLVENAVKYTPEGGHVDVALDLDSGSLVFTVKDNGYGIGPEDQKKLFGRNVRIYRKEWKRVKGTGLGLFIVKNVAQRHGGDAWVESTEGQGSTFRITIPLEGANLLSSQTGASG
jgi:signal transduction histidine kinase